MTRYEQQLKEAIKVDKAFLELSHACGDLKEIHEQDENVAMISLNEQMSIQDLLPGDDQIRTYKEEALRYKRIMLGLVDAIFKLQKDTEVEEMKNRL